MQKLKLLSRSLGGTVNIPPSKSFAHRALICAALSILTGSRNTVSISNLSESRDMQATGNFISALGLKIRKSADGTMVIISRCEDCQSADTTDCIESGSTLRFVIPVAAALGLRMRFTGSGRLPTRPLEVYEKLLPQHGIKLIRESSTEFLPLTIDGNLTPGDFELPGNISSQFISGLMFSLPLLNGDSRIIITTEFESKSYLDITVSVLKCFGIDIEETNYGYFVRGNQQYKGIDYTVEGDWSQAAFFFTMASLSDKEIIINGLNPDSVQGDKKIIDIYSRMGLEISVDDKNNYHLGNKRFNEKYHGLKAVSFDASDIPDAVPAIAMALSQAEGISKISGAARLRIKECDRLQAVSEALAKLGGTITEKPDGLVIIGTDGLHSADINGYNDHRILMSVSSAMQAVKDEVIVSDPYSINKSYPTFYDDYRKLGGAADVIDLG